MIGSSSKPGGSSIKVPVTPRGRVLLTPRVSESKAGFSHGAIPQNSLMRPPSIAKASPQQPESRRSIDSEAAVESKPRGLMVSQTSNCSYLPVLENELG